MALLLLEIPKIQDKEREVGKQRKDCNYTEKVI
jgi:hypothetical protein